MRTVLILAAVLAGLIALPNGARAGEIYILKGFAGIFSLGLDTLGDELVARGYDVRFHSHAAADNLAVEAARLEKAGKGPIVIVGHSLGADAAISMAAKMNQFGAKVALVVLFGPDYHQLAPANVARVLNFYQGSATIGKGPRFKGAISNINLDKAADINHFNIEKIKRLQAEAISRIVKVVGRPRPKVRSAGGR
jgi:pimeloyl-ACP methyl ester carboxylesterase